MATLTCPFCQQPIRADAKFCAYCRAPLLLQNKYRITRLLGRGGYGAVYQAEQLHLGSAPCAIKELLPDPNATPAQQQAASAQFHLEANLLAQLSHPMLPKVTDFFIEGNGYYLVMEYVEGETLEERLTRQNGPLPEAQVLAWARELCDVLTYLHTRQPSPIIHRDIKPANIKITPDGKLKLIDFGISKVLAQGTHSAARAVSPPYSPLEQYGKGLHTDERSDIYALGVTLYALLTNYLPPEAPDRAHESVIPPRQLNLALSPHTEAVILKAMAENPAARYQSAAEMKQALTPVLTTVPAQSKPYLPPPPPLPVPAGLLLLLAGVAGAMLLLCFIVVIVLQNPPLPTPSGPSSFAVAPAPTTLTPTYTVTASPTATSTHTPTLTPTSTSTPTPTSTHTPTRTPTFTPTHTPTPTPTYTPTHTPTPLPPPPPPPVTYVRWVNQHSQKCLTLDPDGVHVIQRTCSNWDDPSQLWVAPSGEFPLQSKSGVCVYFTPGHAELLQTTNCANSPRWRIGLYAFGNYHQIVTGDNLCLDVDSRRKDDGAWVLWYPCYIPVRADSGNQFWQQR